MQTPAQAADALANSAWEECIPEGTPLAPMLERARELHAPNRVKARLADHFDYIEDAMAPVPMPVPVPDLMSTLKRAKEAAMPTNDPAPYGRKRDGTPKAKPGRPPKSNATPAAPDTAKAAAALSVVRETTVASEPEPPAPTNPPAALTQEPNEDPVAFIARQLAVMTDEAQNAVDELDERISALQEQIDEAAEAFRGASAKADRLRRARDAMDELAADEAPLSIAA